jgi:hypothetical protein
MKKLLIALPLVALLLSWGHYGTQQAEAQAVDLSIEVVAAGCTTAGGPTTCYVPVSTQFTVTMNVDVLPPSTGDYKTFQAYLSHSGGLTWVDRPGTAEIVWPDSQIPAEAPGAGYYLAGDTIIIGPASTHIGAILEVDYTCGASPSTETVTMVHGSPNQTYLLDSNSNPAAEAGTESLTIECQAAPPDLSIEVVTDGCTTAGGPTTCYVPVSTQFTVTMNVDVLPPSTGDYEAFQGYLTHTAGLTWVDRPGTGEIVWVCDVPAESPGAGYYLGGCTQLFSPPETQTGAVMEVDYDCGASPSTETVTMVHGSPNNTFLRDSNNNPAAEAGTESLTIECQAAPPVGGLAELPDTAGSSGPNYALLAGVIAAAVAGLTAGAWYARRGWSR